MCNYDYDPPRVYSEVDRVARKKHICSECGREVLAKEKYRNHFGVWDGRPDTFKTCSHCLVVQEWLKKTCGSYIHSQLEEEIYEHADESQNRFEKFMLYRALIGIRRGWKKIKNNSLMQIPQMRHLY